MAAPSTIGQVRDVFPKLGELITHLAIYAGWPNAGTAALIAKQVFEERGA